jgi:putative ABC transport system permease protein
MSVIDRGARNALRSPLRSGAIVIMMAVSIGLLLSMLVARTNISAKIASVKATTATGITINPAGIKGGMGGGEPLTTLQVKTISTTAHISSTTAQLADQLGAADTNLTSSLQLGSFGRRMQRFDQQRPDRPMPTPHINVIGTNNPKEVIATSSITTGAMIDGTSNQLIAMVGKSLAAKNNLSTGSSFMAYGKTFTTQAIFSSGNVFQDSGIIVPLSTLQDATDQAGAVSSVLATVDSSENVAGAVASLKNSLGDKADITSQEDQAASVLEPLQSIANLAFAGVIGAAIASALIILLAMVITVRERRREIGVLKAIGGTNAKVIGQFITEALTLTIIGSVVGLGLGILISGPMTQSLISSSRTTPTQGINSTSQPKIRKLQRSGGFGQQINTNLRQVSNSVSPQTFVVSIGIVLLIAIVGSAVPAWFISRIRPAEVLRTE